VNILELQDRFPNDGAFMDAFIERLYGDDVPCPRCGSVNCTRINEKKFRCRDCKKKFSVLKGTIFENTKLPLVCWLYAILKTGKNSRKGISSCELSRDLGITQKTAWGMLTKIRKAMAGANDALEKLSMITEVDETYVGGKPRKANCKWIESERKEKIPVVSMVERPNGYRAGKARVAVPEPDHKDRRVTNPNILEILEKNVDLQTAEIHTDEAIVYKQLDDMGVILRCTPDTERPVKV